MDGESVALRRSALFGADQTGARNTRLARVPLPEIQAFFESEEGQREFAEWKTQRDAEKIAQE